MLVYLMPPLIGAVIGYFTNYIAVKMLFRPRREVRLFGRRLPFTPGAIPKNKPRLARTIGQVVSDTFFTEENLTAQFMAPAAVRGAVDTLLELLNRTVEQDGLMLAGTEDKLEDLMMKTSDHVTEKILEAARERDFPGMVADACVQGVKAKLQNSMLSLFLTEERLSQVRGQIEEEVNRKLEKEGPEMLQGEIDRALAGLCDRSPLDLAVSFGVSEQQVRDGISRLYGEVVRSGVSALIRQLDVSGMIETKINEMSVEEMEDLVMTVMKKELRLIVNLGGVIGFLLGMVNLLF